MALSRRLSRAVMRSSVCACATPKAFLEVGSELPSQHRSGAFGVVMFQRFFIVNKEQVFYAIASVGLLVKDILAWQKEQQVVFLTIYCQTSFLNGITLSAAFSLRG